jgi:uncharacterized membrane protein
VSRDGALRHGLALFYGLAGLSHFVWPDTFMAIMPDAVPYPYQVVIFTGLCQIAGALGLLTERFRRLAGAMLALYAICVFPANLKHALMALEGTAWPESIWYHGPYSCGGHSGRAAGWVAARGQQVMCRCRNIGRNARDHPSLRGAERRSHPVNVDERTKTLSFAQGRLAGLLRCARN